MDNFDASPPNAGQKVTHRFVSYYWVSFLLSKLLFLFILVGALAGLYITLNYTRGSLFVGGAIGAFVGGLIARVGIHMIDKAMLKNALAMEQSIRNDREREKLKAIAEAKESGRFDRFYKDNQDTASADDGEKNV